MTGLPAILIITGAMAAGKSSVAQALAERLPRSVHLRGDLFRKLIVNGQAEMSTVLSPEARAQLTLRYELSALAADRYAAARFTVIYQDILLGDDLRDAVNRLRKWKPGVVVLLSSPEVIAGREASRPKTGYGAGWTPEGMDRLVRAETPNIGLRLDTSRLTIPETVDTILARICETRTDPR